jgi:hypothetical protein
MNTTLESLSDWADALEDMGMASYTGHQIAQLIRHNIEGLSDRERDLGDLVAWLALPYGENRPLFALADWEGKPLDDGKRLEATYLSVVGERSEPPRVGVAWTRCEMCGTFQTVPVEP